MESSSENLDSATWAEALKARIGELQQQSSQDFKKNRNAGKRQLDAIRTNLSKIIDDLQVRENELADAQKSLLQQTEELEQQRETVSSVETIVRQNIALICDPAKNLEALAQEVRQDISARLSSELKENLTNCLSAANNHENTNAVQRSLNDLDKRLAAVHDSLSSQLPSEISQAIERSLEIRSQADDSATTLSQITEGLEKLQWLLDAAQESIVEQVPSAIVPLLEKNLAQSAPEKLAAIIESKVADRAKRIEEQLNQTRDDILAQVPATLAPLLDKSNAQALADELFGFIDTRIASSTQQLEALLNQTRDLILKQDPERLVSLLDKNDSVSTSDELAGLLDSRFGEHNKQIEFWLKEVGESLAARMPETASNSSAELSQLTELMESLRQRQAECETQRLESIERMNSAERLLDRTAMQRKSVARSLRLKQRLLRSEAERIKHQGSQHDATDQSILQESLDQSQQTCNQLRGELAEAKSRVESLNAELVSTKRTLSSAQHAAEKSKAEVSVLQLQLAECESLLEESIEGTTTGTQRKNRDGDLERRLAEALANQQRLESQLAEATQALSTGRQTTAEIDDAETVAELRRKICDLQEMLAESNCQAVTTVDANAGELESQLRLAEVELHDLRSQNSDLASQVAKLQICIRQNHGPQPHLASENLSWEDRKKLMLMELEAECVDATPQSREKKSEVEAIIARTEAEITRRDREIAELRALIEEQSNARAGIAIGAAAIAELIETDELVQIERDKLRTIQQEWEQKLRQAEIEFSMERARLGRERAQMEEKLRALEATLPANSSAEPEKNEKPSGRRWLDRLGLKDDK